jgi:NADP-dependent 3-hydroxy acid dehydrogenase YdfG
MALLHPERRVAVVSGASSGIGEATARALAERGFPVALGARRGEQCQAIAADIRAAGGEAIGLALDVSSAESVERFAEEVAAELGEVEVVVSNAGTVVIGDAATSSTDAIENDLNINVLGAHRLITAFAPAMIQRRRGDLIFISSDAVHATRPGVAGYLAGKCGLEGLVASLQAELEGTGVRASALRPGATVSNIAAEWEQTEFQTLYESWQKWGVQRHHGILRAEQVALTVALMATLPRGMYLPVVEVQPEAPILRRGATSED